MTPIHPAAAAVATLVDLLEERRHFALLQAGLDQIDQGIAVMDRDLKIVAANRGLFKLFGFPPEMSRVGTPLADLIRYNAERGEYGEGDVEELVAEQVRLASQVEPYETERTRPDGTVIAVKTSPLPNGGWMTIYTDVTQRRASERKVQEQNKVQEHNGELDRVRNRSGGKPEVDKETDSSERKRLEAVLVHAQKMEAAGELTGGLAHDFNNLLTIVISNLAVLRDRAAKADMMEFVAPALVAALKGADITRRLLAFARRQKLEPRIIEVNQLIDKLLSLARHSLPLVISISRHPTPFELHTRVDPERLEHVLLNLVLNARDAMPRGGSLAVHSASRLVHNTQAGELELVPGRYVEIRVEDTGVGMDPATRSRAFEPFFTSKQFGNGSGLGLSVVYGFVKQSGGAVNISSAPGKGTTVTLLLPASPAPPRPNNVSQLPVAGQSVGSSRLVLLVEDDADVRTALRRQLTDIGHMVIEATAGDEALAIIDNVPELSALVSDIVMPGAMDGRRLAHLAKKKRPALRVVLVTGYAQGLDMQGGRHRSFTVLLKPCTKEELATAIETAPQ
jgi:signal transduction histidine kinase